MVDVSLGATNYAVQLGDETVNVQMNIFEGAADSIDDKTVKVTASDTIPSYLENKLTAGVGMQLQLINTGANEEIVVNFTELADINLNTTHRTSDGTDHTFIDQDITITSSPTFVTTNVDSIQLDMVNIPSYSTGQIRWCVADSTAILDTDETDLHVPLVESSFKVKNTSGSIIGQLTCVYPTGASGDNPTVDLADASNFAKTRPVGLIRSVSINNLGVGYATIQGKIAHCNTSAWSEGDKLYVSTTPGELVTTKPVYPNYPVRVGIVARSHATEGIIIVDSDPEHDINQAINVGASPTFGGTNITSIPATNLTGLDTEISANSDVALNTTHRSSDGTDHTYIDQNVTSIGSPTFSNTTITNNLIVSDKLLLDTNSQIKIGTSIANDHGWEDLIGNLTIKVVGVNDPALVVYKGTLREFQFSNSKMTEMYLSYHIPHGYEPGTDMFIHTHWSTSAAETGNAKWYYEISYAKGHNQAAFSTPIITGVIQTGSAIPFQHLIAEIPFTDDGTSLIDRNLIEVDGVLLVRMYRDPADVDDTLTNLPFVHFVDIHYRKGRFATKEKSYPFY